MKPFFLTLSVVALSAAFFPALAEDFSVTADMQRCTSDSDCGLISNNCAQDCGFVAVNTSAVPALQKAFTITCNKPMSAGACASAKVSCVSGLCTAKTDAAVKAPATPVAPTAPAAPAAPAVDYKAGAYNVSEPATPNQVKGDYTAVNDKKGDFSAYNLPQGEVKQKTVGTIVDKIYVPADAPVKGDKYVPVTTAAPAAMNAAPKAPEPAPVAAPAVPAPAPVAQPAAPAAPLAATPPVMPAPPAATAPVPAPPAAPMADMPAMTPSKPNQMPPGLAPVEPIAPSSAKAVEEKVEAPMPTTPDAMADTLEESKKLLSDMPAPETEVTTSAQVPVPAVPAPATAQPAKKSFSVKTDKKENDWNMN